ncbi:MFS transporter, DHA2 family, methylenomycin A resistance protein [Cohnella sp. OV330]|uniref:MFS transporter n=1 Tax=Cohnella sp. OV330 TaxID=1855288 RepID=UPI0008F1EF67|nr:MFS transporter [Cohnella sp. OV330]SFB47006.1 MFS transporter, DHA2 family, methylenomycin A resistance protein [Cohnella sp. OV330]
METVARTSVWRQTKRGRAALLLGLSLGYFMVLMDTTALGVALPAIRADLGGGLSGLQWVVNAYTIVFAGLLLSMGALADRLGAKRVYSAGLAVFLAASALCAASPSLGALVGFRAVLGVGGAALLPASLALLAKSYPEPAARARALGIWAATTGAAMAIGPVAGGLLADGLGWRSIFLINVPLAAVSLILVGRIAGADAGRVRRGLDPAGQATCIAAIASLAYALTEGQTRGWTSPVVLGALGLFALASAGFAAAEWKGKTPLLPLRLLAVPTVSAGMLSGLLVNVGLSGVLFALPLYFQQARGYEAHAAGLALLPMTIPLAFNPILTGRIVGRVGARLPMTAGFALCATGILTLAGATGETGYVGHLIGLLLVGFGTSLAIPSLMAAVMAASPPEWTGSASGALNASRQLGATLGVVLMGAFLGHAGSTEAGVRQGFIALGFVLAAGAILAWSKIGRERRG